LTWKTKLILFGIILITGLIYLKTSSFSFVSWDDDENIKSNTHLVLKSENIKYHYENSRYKAVAIWSFMFDNYLFGNKLGGFHIHNVLLHLINILLVFLLMLRIAKKETIAIIVAGLFALHPAFVEAVTWTSGRKDLLFVLFSLLSVLAYRKYLMKQQNILWLLLVMVLVYAASLAKIQAYTLPLLFIGFDWFNGRRLSFQLVIEKLMLLAMIADKWPVFLILSTVIFILFLYKKYSYVNGIKINRNTVFLFWYLFSFLFLIILAGIFKSFYPGKFKIIISVVAICFLVFLSVKNKKTSIAHLGRMNNIWYNIMFLLPLLLIALIIFRDRIFYWIGNLGFYYWGNQVGEAFSFPERFILAANALAIYFLRLFLFYPQNPMISYPQHLDNGSLPVNLYITAVITIIFIVGVIFLIYKYLRKNKIILFGSMWFVACICIVLHFIPIQGRVIAADRYTYPSYIGLFMIIGALADFYMERYTKRSIIIILCVVTGIMIYKTDSGVKIWKSSKTLWSSAIKADPKNHYALSALSMAYFSEGSNIEAALMYADKAIILKSDHQYYNNRGKIKYFMNDFDGALDDFNKAISLDSNSFAAYNNRGAVYQQNGGFQEALKDYTKALEMKPDYTNALDNKKKVIRLMAIDSIVLYGTNIFPVDTAEAVLLIKNQSKIFINTKQYGKAIEYLSKGIKLMPENVDFYDRLAITYHIKKDYDSTLITYNRGLNIFPDNPMLLFGRGMLHINMGDTTNACLDLQRSSGLGNAKASEMAKRFCN
jgi:tetratricopeptide (TPR) repeat protein